MHLLLFKTKHTSYSMFYTVHSLDYISIYSFVRFTDIHQFMCPSNFASNTQYEVRFLSEIVNTYFPLVVNPMHAYAADSCWSLCTMFLGQCIL